MDFTRMIERVRQYTRDTTSSIFREKDIMDFINEGIDRLKVIPQLRKMNRLVGKNETPKYLPAEFCYLIPIYATARCFEQDERHYQAVQKMNEFEAKLEELRSLIESGEIVIKETDGTPIDLGDSFNDVDYVIDAYYKTFNEPS